ncbi:MAG: tRNA (adenosine(37)-N6)-threonylcarbamoyltransferase complex ATPase subunit type 1 TsaE [Phyllobacteriaceae bacterium]|nr:tRNA (adenosine(37)-N6)-threonylcarbamoyltransferase complex ATPase subunit type 1 TsaE [Phyllobacteriaceae bacterium]MBA90216.1 tRNA (adenosine(37)-N6)-threonylcarbamoyltransferase complex ATPase subunit type 1 TsaE [Phyllobacteriaceae bacterium]
MERFATSVALPCEAATLRLGEDLAMALKPGDVLALSGDLGAGKTSLARALIRAIADDDLLEVPSPTFTLVQGYDGLRLPIAHFDLYRLSGPDELEELGLDEALGEGAALIEWPERAAGLLPDSTIRLDLSHEGEGRRADIACEGPAGERVARSLAIRAFLAEAGWGTAERRFLTGDASARAYETATLGEETRILMDAPRMPDGPPILDGLPYSRIAHLAEDVAPFVAIARALHDEGFAAPQIHAADLDAGLLLTEHLGPPVFLDAAGKPVRERYEAAARMLAALHLVQWPRALPVAEGIVHHVPDYDRRAMLVELDLLPAWYQEFASGAVPDKDARDAFLSAWNTVLDQLEDCETSLVLRDFHSPNIIWRADREGLGKVGVIDFQDAMTGPSAYDVASLAQDARVTISPDLEKATVEAYCEAREAAGPFDRAAFERAYAIMAAQRNSKILGIFVRLDRRDGKPSYLKHLPRIRDYLSRVLGHEALAPVRGYYRDLGIVPGKQP